MRNFRRFSALLLSLLLILLLIPSVAGAASGSATLSGNASVQSGSTVTLTLSVSGANIYGFEGVLSYGSGLSSPSISQSIGGYWDVSVQSLSDGSIKIVAQDLKMTSPITSSANLCTIQFTVGSGLSQGTALSAKVSNISMADNSSITVSCSDCSWSGSVGASPSKDNDLSSLSCSNATLSPAFSKGTTYYTCSVPYSTTSLNLSYSTNDKGAKVSVTGNSLSVGSNTINLVVTAASGATKTYQIVATRGQDPNYQASNDATLSGITLLSSETNLLISPAFSSTVKEYMAYVPNEITQVTLKGKAHSDKAKLVTEATGVKLSPSTSTDLQISCTAEDGTTTETYTVHVFRMPAYNGIIPTVELKDPVNPEDLEPQIPMLSFPATIDVPLFGEINSLLLAAILFSVVLLLLFLLGLMIGKNRGGYYTDEPEYDEEDEPIGSGAVPAEERPVPRRPAPRQAYDFEKDVTSKEEDTDEYAEFAQPSAEELEVLNASSENAPVEKRPGTATPKEEASKAEPVDEEKLAEDSVKNMSLDDLLKDIKNM